MAAITQSELTAYNPSNAASIIAGPTALFTVNVNSIDPTQLNEGFAEVNTKANAFDDITSAAALQTALLGDIEPVVIGPNGQLYITDGHHTFTALLDSAWGASNPTVDVNVIANYSGDTFAQFYAALAANDLEYPVNDGVVVTPSAAALSANGAFGTSLTGLTSDVYRGLEYSILKNKNSKLFTTATNIAGAVGSAIPGLDKTAAFYSDFIYADAYRDANGGKGLPYLSPGDIQLATQWNLNGANVTTLPGLGAVLVAQLPGYILSASISISGAISNATLANGVLDGSKTGAFTTAASASFNGLRSLNVGPSSIGSGAPGFIMQLGADSGYTVTLTGANTYTGGTTILAGTLIINADAALGAAGASGAISSASIVAGAEADNGIIFDSLTEGNGTLQITASFTESRAIVLESEVANINLNNFTLTLASPLYSAGALSDGLSNAAAETPITVEDTSTGGAGVLVLSATSTNSNFYGNWIITSGTLKVSSDASLGNTTGSPELIGQIDLNGGILQAGASFTSVRSLFLGGGSTYDTNGFATVWQGNLQDVQRTLTIKNSSTTTAGSVAFGTFEAGATAILNVTGSSATATDSVTFTNGIIRDTAATLLLEDTTSGGVLGATGGFVYDTSTGAGATNTVTNRIVSPWIAVQTATAIYSFATYGTKGFTAATGLATTLVGSTSSTTVSLTGPLNLAVASSAYALSMAASATVTTLGFTLTLGDGANPTGLILDGGASLGTATGALAGTLATAGSELVIWAGGTAATANTIDAKITGSAGLDVSGAGTVTINTATAETGAVTIDSGVVGLATANVFATASSVNLSNVKTSPSPAVLTITANQTFEALNSVGNNSSVNFSSGAAITIGDATNQSSAISATFTETGAATAGAITKNGTGLVDLSGGKVTLISGSTILVNAGVLRGGNGIFGTQATTVTVASGAELQYNGNGGSQLSLNVAGAGAFHLISGTVQILGTLATTANTALELGTTLDVTTAAFTGANAAITDAGGTVVFDQTTTGSYAGVISDGFEAGGATDPLDLATASGTAEQGTLIKDDSVSDKLGNVTLTKAQTFTGATYIEAGTLTLGAVNTLATSSGVSLGRVGGGATAVLALAAANQIAGLADTAGNTDSVTLGSFTLTVNSASGAQNAFAGIISGAGALVTSGTGTQTLSGANTFAGGLTLKGGTTVLANTAAAGAGAIAFSGAATLQIALGDAPANTITGFAIGDTIDLAGVGTETTTVYSNANGTVTVTGGASSVTLKLNAPPANYGYQATADGAGGTDLTLVTLPAAPSVTAVTGTLFSNSDVTVSGAGISGDTVTLYDGTTLVGSGTVSAGAFSILTSQPLPFGPQTVTATQTIPAGPASNASAGFGVEINQAIVGASGPVTLTTPQTYVTLGATVTNAAGAALTGTGATPFILLNKGSVTASGNGVYLQAGSVTNAATGIITNTAYTAGPGVKAAGIALGAAASLTNAGSIGGVYYGVLAASGDTVTNTGTITATKSTGLDLEGAGSVSNAADGLITGALYGLYATGAATVTNAGSIGSANIGVYLAAGGTVTNQAAGTITGLYAIYAHTAATTVTNAGTISATDSGVYLQAGGTVSNTSSIYGGNYGVFSAGAASVTNTGSIIGGDGGIVLNAGGTVVNTGNIGCQNPNGYAVAMHGGNDLLVISPTASFQGKVIALGGTTRTIELTSAASVGTIASIGSTRGLAFTGFTQVNVDAGAKWILSGSAPMVFLGGGGDSLTIGSAAPVSITAGLGVDTVNLGTGLATLTEAHGSAQGDVINGFASNDVIHFTGFGAGAAVTALGSDVYKVGTAASNETLTVNGVALNSHNALFS